MLTVFIEADYEPTALAATLATLIPGAIEGVVREVVVIDRAGDAAVRKVADHAGCRLVTSGDLSGLVASARGEWLMLLEPGARLSTHWIDAVTEHVIAVADDRRTPRAARFTSLRRDRGGGLLSTLFQSRTALRDGLLMPKDQGIGLSKRSKTLEDMAKGLASLRLEVPIRPRSPARSRA